MVKKKAEVKNDLTRIEDLSEFVHEDNTEVDNMFLNFSPDSNESSENTSASLFPEENTEDGTGNEGLSFDSQHVEESSESSEFTFDTSALDETPEESSSFEPAETEESMFSEPTFEENSSDEGPPIEENTFSGTDPDNTADLTDTVDSFTQAYGRELGYDNAKEEEEDDDHYAHARERFEDVKAFAQNFSYGKVSMKGGNPPYTIIARHIKYQDDAQDILDLLCEFGIVNDDTIKDIQKSLEFGSLIIPQISEYTAIVLAHKLRRFDLDLEVGLSDEVHPSKSGEGNPRGLLKKKNLKQNRSESVNLKEIANSIKDIVVSTSSSIPGHYVEEYIGVQTTFAIVEEAELEKLQYVEKTQREHAELYDYNNEELLGDLSTEKAFKDYHNSFSLLYEDLALQLKQKAYTQKANALLGLSFQLSPLQFERSHLRVNAYQITCSATLAVIGREKN